MALALIIHDVETKEIVTVQDVPGQVVLTNQENTSKRWVVEDTATMKELYTLKGYDISKIEEYEQSLV